MALEHRVSGPRPEVLPSTAPNERGIIIPFPVRSHEPPIPEPIVYATTPDEEEAYRQVDQNIYFNNTKVDAAGEARRLTAKGVKPRNRTQTHPRHQNLPDVKRHNEELAALYEYRLTHGTPDINAYLEARRPVRHDLLPGVETTVMVDEPRVLPMRKQLQATGDE